MDLWPQAEGAGLCDAVHRGRCSRPSSPASTSAPEIPVKQIALGCALQRSGRSISSSCSVAHSIPESNALIIRTPLGNVLHTGDWKIDPTPVVGPPTDEAKLRALGAEGVPRADRRLHQRSARRALAVGDGGRGRNRQADRELARSASRSPPSPPTWRASAPWPTPRARPSARSWWSAAPWTASSAWRARRAISTACSRSAAWTSTAICRRIKVVALCTGSQGEPRAALARIAADEHPEVALSRGDRVIFSSRHHSGQREGDRPRHQRADRPGRRGHHRPDASGARLRPSAHEPSSRR